MGIACCTKDDARPDPEENYAKKKRVKPIPHHGGLKQHASILQDPSQVVFDLVHKDGSGVIDIDDFADAVKMTGADMTGSDIEKLFHTINTQKEGFITYEEFKYAIDHIEVEGGDIFRAVIENTLSHWLSEYSSKYGCHADVPHHYKIPAENAWALLLNGNKRYINEDQTAYLLSLVTKVRKIERMRYSQNPYAIVLCCADSRVQPSLCFEAGPGEIFVIRTAGNVVDASVIGSIEYAVQHLGTNLLVVLGHQRCGAVTAAMEYKLPRPSPSMSDLSDDKRNIHDILSKIHPSCKAAQSEAEKRKFNEEQTLDLAIQKNVACMAKEVKDNSPVLQLALEQGNFQIRQATYILDTGRVVPYDVAI